MRLSLKSVVLDGYVKIPGQNAETTRGFRVVGADSGDRSRALCITLEDVAVTIECPNGAVVVPWSRVIEAVPVEVQGKAPLPQQQGKR